MRKFVSRVGISDSVRHKKLQSMTIIPGCYFTYHAGWDGAGHVGSQLWHTTHTRTRAGRREGKRKQRGLIKLGQRYSRMYEKILDVSTHMREKVHS